LTWKPFSDRIALAKLKPNHLWVRIRRDTLAHHTHDTSRTAASSETISPFAASKQLMEKPSALTVRSVRIMCAHTLYPMRVMFCRIFVPLFSFKASPGGEKNKRRGKKNHRLVVKNLPIMYPAELLRVYGRKIFMNKLCCCGYEPCCCRRLFLK